LIPINIIFFMTYIVFLNQKDQIFDYLKENKEIREKFFNNIQKNKSETQKFNQIKKLDEIHDFLDNDTDQNESLNFKNFFSKNLCYVTRRYL
jgi:hypothetical protein